MKVSIILTSYNRPHLVREAVQSVVQQTYKDWQLIIVDDGSEEETKNVIVDQAMFDSRIHLEWLQRDKFVGCRYARSINAGLELVNGELITYLTDDDYYLPERLGLMVEKMQDPNIHVVYGNQRVEWMGYGNGQRAPGLRGTFGVTRNPQCRIDHNSFMHRKSCLQLLEKPYWPEHDWMNGDIQFFNRLVAHWDFHPIEQVLDVHRWHPNNVQERIMRALDPVYTQEI